MTSTTSKKSTEKTEGDTKTDGFVWDEHTWKVLDEYFKQPKILAHNQLNSYNDFIDNIIPSLIKNHNPIVVGHDWDPVKEKFRIRYEVEFAGQPYMSRPQINEGSGSIRNLYPNEARLRGLSYSAYMYLDVTHRIYENDVLIEPEKHETQIPFKFPCMLHSEYCYLEQSNAESLRQMGECPYDLGGYFIINGSEKVIISQERPVDNKVLCFKQKEGNAKYDEIVEVRSTIDQRFFPVRNNWVSLTLPKEGEADQYLRVFFPYLTNSTPIPLMVVFRAIGITTDKEICEMILGSNVDREGVNDDIISLILPSFEELVDVTDEPIGADGRVKRSRTRLRKKITTQHDALLYISRHITMNMEYLENKLSPKLNDKDKATARDIAKKQYVLDILRRDLLPHMGYDFRNKALFLGHMVWTMIQCKLGLRNYDVRDHYANKRLDLSGPLLKKLFQGSFGRLIKEIKKEINRTLEDTSKGRLHPGLRKVIQNCNMEAPIKKALSTGDWSTSKNANLFSSTNLGIAQVLQRLSYIAYLSNIRRIQTPMEKAGGKITEPRKLDPTQYGYVCPNETPEGQQVGIVKNLAMTTTVTISSSTLPLKTALKQIKLITSLDEIDPRQIYYQTKVFLNGEWLGCTMDPYKIHNMIKRFKRDGTFSPYIGIYWNYEHRELHIRTDGGRYTRPLYVVEKIDDKRKSARWVPKIELYWNKKEEDKDKPASEMTWKELIRNGYIEYIDPEECENCMIAITRDVLEKNREDKPEFYTYTHLELHPSMSLGVVSQMIPFSDHNQSPRNCFQCLSKEEKVKMADGSKKRIADIKIGEKVISIDPITYDQFPATVINQYVRKTDKKMLCLMTLSGRKLVCTEDHPILTINGWKQAKDILDDDLICVCPDNILFDKTYAEQMKENEYELHVKYIKEMQEQGTDIDYEFMEDWKNRVIVRNFSIFVPIDTISSMPNMEIADITIDKDSHSFITGNDICVHNSSMAKQALGLYATDFNQRMDTMAHVLCYPQKPLITTRTTKYTNLNVLTHGQQCIVAVASYTGYNQEDSILLNKSAIERGKFNSLYFKTYVSEMNPHKSSTAEEEKFGKPDPNRTQGMKHGLNAYDNLDDEGFAKIGSYVETNDVLIGKTVKLKDEIKGITGRRITHSDISVQVKQGDHGYVDKRIPSSGSVKNLNADNNPFCKIRIVQWRQPVIGDKLASRSAQKATIGLILPEEDLPVTDNGMVPDIVMNPHALPSRMTVGQMLECIFGKAACMQAEVKDATPFTSCPKQEIGDILESYGYERNGEEVMYNGYTGEQLKTSIFIGPVYYQRLKHMVHIIEPLWEIKFLQVQIYWATHSKSGEVLYKVLVPNQYRNILVASGKTRRYGNNLKHRDNPELVILTRNGKMGVQRLDVCGWIIRSA